VEKGERSGSVPIRSPTKHTLKRFGGEGFTKYGPARLLHLACHLCPPRVALPRGLLARCRAAAGRAHDEGGGGGGSSGASRLHEAPRRKPEADAEADRRGHRGVRQPAVAEEQAQTMASVTVVEAGHAAGAEVGATRGRRGGAHGG
jgi:hypothetical protein